METTKATTTAVAGVIEELNDIKRGLAEVWEKPDGGYGHQLKDAEALYVTIREQTGHNDPRALAFAALNLATWAIDRIKY